jgi:tRNA (guanine37-N1)-methyltransferase
MHIIFLTLYPEMFPATLGHGVAGRAFQQGLWNYETINIRDYATDKHQKVDDTPYGGGAGMVMKADVVARAIDAAFERSPKAQLICPSPHGRHFTQAQSHHLATTHASVIFLCGRFEAIDQRIIEHYQPLEVSIGDYILLGGEVAALAISESMLRHISGVLGNAETHDDESFMIGKDCAGLLEYPHYTKPPIWNGYSVPEVLTSGNHQRIDAWRREQSEQITARKRPELWKEYCNIITPEGQKNPKGSD